MKNSVKYLAFAIAALVSLNSCNGFLEPKNPGIVDADFVFSSIENTKGAMNQVYEDWRSMTVNTCFGNGLYYQLDMPGSDIERHPEAYANQPSRQIAEGLYENGNAIASYNIDNQGGIGTFYSAIANANNVINAMEASDKYEEYMKDTNPNEMSQVYGEAVAARATYYRELLKYYGDVPFTVKSGVPAKGITPRDSIYEFVIADLERVIPHMYRLGEVPGWGTAKNVFSRTYAEAMLCRLCLDAAGYQLRRVDLGNDFYKNLKGEVLQFETIGKPNAKAGNAIYGRRTDYKTLYEKAKKYYADILANSGSAKLLTTDPRGEYDSKLNKYYGNPFQYFFQQNNDLVFPEEAIYENDMTWNAGGNNERPYAFGRVSGGGKNNFFPCKSYGQCRINPAFYFGIFDPNDMRRDVACSVTGSTGSGAEVLIPFAPGSTVKGGGITCNKWDESRQAKPNLFVQRKSGIKSPYMRIAEVYYGYAEACAITGDDAKALELLKTMRKRSFPEGKDNTDQFVKDCGSLLKAIIEDRGFEYAAEGDRRWTLIRTGLLPEKIKRVKELTAEMIDGLDKNGYYEFANGNVISANVWVKLVDGKASNGHRLTTQTPAGKENDPVLYPGWRGQNDDWAATGAAIGITEANIKKNLTAGDNTNLAIMGLFDYIEPDSEEAKALEASGYKKTAYGSDLVKYKGEYLDKLFPDYDYESAPVYICAFGNTSLETIKGLSNGYGFSNGTKK